MATTGIQQFAAVILPANDKLPGVFRDSGFRVELQADPSQILVELPTSPTPRLEVKMR